MVDRPAHPRNPTGGGEPAWMTPEYWNSGSSLDDRKNQGKFLYHLADNLIGFEDEYETRGEKFGQALNQAGQRLMEDPLGFGLDLARDWRDKLERVRYGPLAYATEDYASVRDIPPEAWNRMEEAWNMDLLDMSSQPLAPGASRLLTHTPTDVGIFAGNAAQGQKHSKAAQARLMKEEGASDREIYDATGYQYAPEQGDWQFVISPKGMSLNSKNYELTDQEFVNTIKSDTKSGGNGARLTQLIDWPELFDNYPQLKDYNLRFQDQRGAYFNKQDREIVVSTDYLDSPTTLKEVLSHELQHGVQSFDRTIGGSNPQWVLKHDPFIREQVDEATKAVNSRSISTEEYRNRMKEIYDQGFRRYQANEGEIEARGAGLMNFMTQDEIDEMLPSEIKRMALPKEKDKYRGSVMPTGYAEGGEVTNMEVDPVSGNEVPPGAEPKNVRDDIDAKLSEGEYVIPADVVKFYGLSHFEKLISKAKDGLAEMEANGRMGGEDVEEEDDLPFDDDELLAEDEETLEMAEGGPVFDPNSFATGFSTFGGGSGGYQTKIFINSAGERRSIMFIGGQPVQAIPEGFVEDTPQARQQFEKDNKEAEPTKPTEENDRAGRGEEEDYGLKTEVDYTKMSSEGIQKEMKAGQALAGLVGGLIGGPLGAGAVKGLAGREQMKTLQEQGLNPEDYGFGKKKEEPGLLGRLGNSIFKDKTTVAHDKRAAEEQAKFEADTRDYWDPERTKERDDTRNTFGNDEDGDPDPYSKDVDTTGFAKGGLVRKRTKTPTKRPSKKGLGTKR